MRMVDEDTAPLSVEQEECIEFLMHTIQELERMVLRVGKITETQLSEYYERKLGVAESKQE